MTVNDLALLVLGAEAGGLLMLLAFILLGHRDDKRNAAKEVSA